MRLPIATAVAAFVIAIAGAAGADVPGAPTPPLTES